ncbi:hypothetical protein [Bacteroides heparinolyticus]|uniref:hypothetical protein n=1 Tax=Prevotella heparinolytica TaxID=28113 RepID=UPI0035A1C3CE
MRKKRKINWTLITIILLNIFSILFIKLYDQNKYLKTREGIKENGTYAMGEIVLFSKGTWSQIGTISITYQFQDKHYRGDIVSGHRLNMREGEKYIVIFDSTNLKSCVLLHNYPVTDSIQFLKDVEYLKKYPPTGDYESWIWKCFKDKKRLW